MPTEQYICATCGSRQPESGPCVMCGSENVYDKCDGLWPCANPKCRKRRAHMGAICPECLEVLKSTGFLPE